MQAVILAAGFGSRLSGVAASKPLVPVAGKPLLLHTLERVAKAGVAEAVIVLGHRADAVEAALARWDLPLPVCTVRSDPVLPNGASVLAAAPLLLGRALLLMADHIVDPALYRQLAAAPAERGEVLLGVDRRMGHRWIDPGDVTRVRTDGTRIVAIGKALADYNGYDTGVFSFDGGLINVLGELRAPSLSEGVARLAEAGSAHAVESGDADWIDVDDARALSLAEDWLTAKARVAA